MSSAKREELGIVPTIYPASLPLPQHMRHFTSFESASFRGTALLSGHGNLEVRSLIPLLIPTMSALSG